MEIYHREGTNFSVVLMLSSKAHYSSVQLLGRVKIFAVIEGQRICYLFEDRKILVKYDNNTYGIIPAALLVIEASNKSEHWVSEQS